MTSRSLLTVILAAGKGTRMKSAMPKVLHGVAGRSMLAHVMALAKYVGGDKLAVVIGPEMDNVRKEVLKIAPHAQVFVQENQLGTADAVLAARPALVAHDGDVMVLYADTPLIQTETVRRLRSALTGGTGVAVLGFEAADPAGYGRLLTDAAGNLTAIREEKDANDAERKVRLCNSGVIGFSLGNLVGVLDAHRQRQRQGRILPHRRRRDRPRRTASRLASSSATRTRCWASTRATSSPSPKRSGSAARASRLMQDGATLIAPETVWLSYDTEIGRDVLIEPNVFFGPGRDRRGRRPHHGHLPLRGARHRQGRPRRPVRALAAGRRPRRRRATSATSSRSRTRPWARAPRPTISPTSATAASARAPTSAPARSSATTTASSSTTTEIGEGAFVGSNSSLVAPVKIGEGAYIGSGSVITKDVAPDALALERATQESGPAGRTKFRTMMTQAQGSAEVSRIQRQLDRLQLETIGETYV